MLPITAASVAVRAGFLASAVRKVSALAVQTTNHVKMAAKLLDATTNKVFLSMSNRMKSGTIIPKLAKIAIVLLRDALVNAHLIRGFSV